jgi:hypothetical protein
MIGMEMQALLMSVIDIDMRLILTWYLSQRVLVYLLLAKMKPDVAWRFVFT